MYKIKVMVASGIVGAGLAGVVDLLAKRQIKMDPTILRLVLIAGAAVAGETLAPKIERHFAK